jgi:hypothetical protein
MRGCSDWGAHTKGEGAVVAAAVCFDEDCNGHGTTADPSPAEGFDGCQCDCTEGYSGGGCEIPPSLELPESNCPIPVNSKSCHFWGDPHVSHLFFSHMEMNNNKKGGRHHGRHLVEFRPFGVFNLASNADMDFEAQAFFCPWRNSGAPGIGAGLAMRFGDDIIQVVRGEKGQAKNGMHTGGWDAEVTQFFVNDKKVEWNELGNATGLRGSQVPGTGGITSPFMYMQQEKTTNQNPYLPVCAGNQKDTLVEVGVQSMYYQDVTIRTNQPGTEGICSVENGEMSNDPNLHETYRVPAKHNLFSTRRMKHLCHVCNLDVHSERWGDTCGAPGVNVSPEAICTQAGHDHEQARSECAKTFCDENGENCDAEWLDVCVMETCASGEGAVAIAKIEEHLQRDLVAAE